MDIRLVDPVARPTQAQLPALGWQTAWMGHLVWFGVVESNLASCSHKYSSKVVRPFKAAEGRRQGTI